MTSSLSFSRYLQVQKRWSSTHTPPKPSRVFFDISAGGSPIGKITFQLYDDKVPKTAKNFYELCKARNGSTYRNCLFHRVIPGFMLQGGDFTHHNGMGGQSIYGPRFEDENFIYKHDKPGLLSMANAGPNTNGSQFFITTVATPWLDGKHVVFGEVEGGMDVVKQIEQLGSTSGKPRVKVAIEDCGPIEQSEP